jgi:hypothetical protein
VDDDAKLENELMAALNRAGLKNRADEYNEHTGELVVPGNRVKVGWSLGISFFF